MWRRRQQIAYRLARLQDVEQVIYVEFPLTLPSFLKVMTNKAASATRSRWDRVFRQGFISIIDRVYVVTPIAPLSPSYPSAVTKFSNAFGDWQVRQLVKKAIEKCQGNHRANIILWMSHPLLAKHLEDFPGAFICYDANDRMDQLRNWTWLNERILANDEALTRRAHVVFTQVVAEYDKKRNINPYTYVMPNAVDYHLSAQAEACVVTLQDTSSIPRPILGYVGNVDDRLDYDLICAVARNNPQWSFVFVGPVGPAAKPDEITRLKETENTYLLGGKAYHEVPLYTRQFDVCLLPHRVKGATESQSPLKLFDYLASGRPIVSTPIAGLEGFDEFVSIGASPYEFADQVTKALVEDAPEKAAKRKAMAASNSWDTRVGQMWSVILERMSNRK